MLAAALCVALFASAAMAASDDASLRSEIAAGGTVTLTNDVTLDEDSGAIQITKDVTLNLNGFTLKRNSSQQINTFVIEVDGATLTVEDTGNSSGRIESVNEHYGCARGIRIGMGASDGSVVGNGGTVILNGGTISAGPELQYMGYGVELIADCTAAQGSPVNASITVNDGAKIEAGYAGILVQGKTAEVNIEGGEISATAFGISGNGSTSGVNLGGTVININGGTITSEMGVGIFHPQDGTLTVNDGAITGYDGIQMKSGTLVVNGGVITGEGTNANDLTGTGNNDTGAAVSIISMGGATGSYAGNMYVTFNGGTLISEQENAIFEASASGADIKFESLTINEGTFKGAAGKDAISMANRTEDNTIITAGTFSSDISSLFDGVQTAQDEDGNYYVVVPATQIDIDLANISNYWVADKQAYQLTAGQTVQLGAVMTPPNATDVPTWYSNDETVVTVDQTGLLTAVNVGETAVGVTVGSESGDTSTAAGASIPVHVVAATIPATNIEFAVGNTYEIKLSEFDTVLEVTYTPTDATTRELVWSSSDTAVATVDAATGKITPLKAGKTTITAALADNNTVKATCEVTVIDDSATSDDVTSDDVKPQPSGSGGGGCSAGFGALALLAALPLLRMRKK